MTHDKPNLSPKIALYEPDIPQNTASIIRTCSCLGAQLEIIEPCGFLFTDKRFKRVVMDYMEEDKIKFYKSSEDFFNNKKNERVILITTKAIQSYSEFNFKIDDTLLFGRESAGVPKYVHEAADKSVHIPIISEMRSLNIVQAASILVGESLRQLDGFPNSRIICSAKPKL